MSIQWGYAVYRTNTFQRRRIEPHGNGQPPPSADLQLEMLRSRACCQLDHFAAGFAPACSLPGALALPLPSSAVTPSTSGSLSSTLSAPRTLAPSARYAANHCIREETIDAAIRQTLGYLNLADVEIAYLAEQIPELNAEWMKRKDEGIASLRLRLAQLATRLDHLTDAYLDRLIDRDAFEQRKTSLLDERRSVEEQRASLEQDNEFVTKRLAEFFELLKRASIGYEFDPPEEKRDLLDILFSNLSAHVEKVELTLKFPFGDVANRPKSIHGVPNQI